jgi:hypothetical protein
MKGICLPWVLLRIRHASRAQPLTDMPFTPGKILRALGKV